MLLGNKAYLNGEYGRLLSVTDQKTVAAAKAETLFHQCAPVATGRDFLGIPEANLQHGGVTVIKGY